MPKIFIGFISRVCLILCGVYASSNFASSTSIGEECVSINGMYVALNRPGSNAILGDNKEETKLLSFAKNNGFN